MKKSVLVLIIIILNSLVAFAELNDNELNEIKSKINQKKHLIPPGLRKFFNEMNAVVVIDGVEYSAVSMNGELVQLTEGKPENPTMEILVAESVIRDIITNEMGFSEALDNGKVIYRPISRKNKIIHGIAKFGRVINRILWR